MHNQLFVEEEIEVNHIVHSVLSLVFCKGGREEQFVKVCPLFVYVCVHDNHTELSSHFEKAE